MTPAEALRNLIANNDRDRTGHVEALREALAIVERATPKLNTHHQYSAIDDELLRRSAKTGIEELGKVCYETWLSIAGSAGATAWPDLPPFSRTAWRRAAQAIWDMAR